MLIFLNNKEHRYHRVDGPHVIIDHVPAGTFDFHIKFRPRHTRDSDQYEGPEYKGKISGTQTFSAYIEVPRRFDPINENGTQWSVERRAHHIQYSQALYGGSLIVTPSVDGSVDVAWGFGSLKLTEHVNEDTLFTVLSEGRRVMSNQIRYWVDSIRPYIAQDAKPKSGMVECKSHGFYDASKGCTYCK